MQLCRQEAQRSSTVQEEELANEGRHHLHKQVHDKKKELQNHYRCTQIGLEYMCERWASVAVLGHYYWGG